MHGHSLSLALGIAGFVVALVTLIVQIMSFRKGK
jgi:hypothetical protein